jgi:hypothetical protein
MRTLQQLGRRAVLHQRHAAAQLQQPALALLAALRRRGRRSSRVAQLRQRCQLLLRQRAPLLLLLLLLRRVPLSREAQRQQHLDQPPVLPGGHQLRHRRQHLVVPELVETRVSRRRADLLLLLQPRQLHHQAAAAPAATLLRRLPGDRRGRCVSGARPRPRPRPRIHLHGLWRGAPAARVLLSLTRTRALAAALQHGQAGVVVLRGLASARRRPQLCQPALQPGVPQSQALISRAGAGAASRPIRACSACVALLLLLAPQPLAAQLGANQCGLEG